MTIRALFICSLSIGLCLPLPAAADFESAANAYRSRNYNAAYAQFKPLAEAGDARAMTVLALMYKYGESVKPDLGAAFNWYVRAAEREYAPAQYNAGLMLARGEGVPRNRAAAVQWLRMAAAAGFKRANRELAFLDASPIADPPQVDELTPWSTTWNLKLPERFRAVQRTSPLPAPTATNYKVQLGAMRSETAARALWNSLADAHEDLFQSLSPHIWRSETNQLIYRVQALGFDSRAAATAFCAALTARPNNGGCLVLRPLAD